MGYVFDNFGKKLRDASNLIYHGVIPQTFTENYSEGTIPQSQLNNPDNGVTYQVNEDGTITETRRLLPASELWLEIRWKKYFGYGRDPSSISAPTGIIGGLFSVSIPSLTFRNITDHFVFHLLSSRLYVNFPITITQDMIDNGRSFQDYDINGNLTNYTTAQIYLGAYPLSVFAVVKQRTWQEDNIDVTGGINFTEEQLKYLGDVQAGINPLDGLTGKRGQFGRKTSPGYPNSQLDLSPVPYDLMVDPDDSLAALDPPTKNLFIQIKNDIRRFKFRADNEESYTKYSDSIKVNNQEIAVRRWMPPKDQYYIDGTDANIEIRINEPGFELKAGDVVYITTVVADNNRFLRQRIKHDGSAAFANNKYKFLPQKQTTRAWNFALSTWQVPIKNGDLPNSIFDDYDWKLTVSQYETEGTDAVWENLSGWRLSESLISENEFLCFAADERGILLVDKTTENVSTVWPAGDVTVKSTVYLIYAADDIYDKNWWIDYIRNLKKEFIPALSDLEETDPNYNNIIDGYELKDIENYIDSSTSGFLYDLSSPTNSLLYDNQKVFYHRPFALALQEVSNYDGTRGHGVGCVLLDLLRWGIVEGQENLSLYDLSFSNFVSYPMFTNNPKSYGGLLEGEGHAPADVYSLTVPPLYGKYDISTRFYMERATGWKSWGELYLLSFLDSGSLSSSIDYYGNYSCVAFEDTVLSNSIAFQEFDGGKIQTDLQSLNYSIDRNHNKETFDPATFKYIGYDCLIGSYPSYSYGIPINESWLYTCSNPETYADVFEVEEANLVKNAFGTIESVSLDSQKLIYNMYLHIDEADIAKLRDYYVSFKFSDNDSVINNLIFPSIRDEGITLKQFMALYPAGSIKFYGEIFTLLDIDKVELFTITFDKMNQFKALGRSVSLAFGSKGKIYIFYSDDNNNNISVAVNEDNTHQWVIYKDLIPLAEGESASYPYVMSSNNLNEIHLFYVLNNKFLMYKNIPIYLFNCYDSFVEYVRPSIYDVTKYNTDEDPLKDYSTNGKTMRKSTSYFIHGNSEDQFFKDALEETKEIDVKIKNGVDIVPRLGFRGYLDINQKSTSLDRLVSDPIFSIFKDASGNYKMFFIDDNKVSIKTGRSETDWSYLVKDFPHFHKNFIPADNNSVLPIRNIKVLYRDSEPDLLHVLYFHDNMLFMRILHNSLLDGSGVNNRSVISSLYITKGSPTSPIFLVGQLNSQLKNEKIKIENNIANGMSVQDANEQSDLAVFIPYSIDEVNKFDSNMAIDSTITVDGYFTKEGYLRIFYKDSGGKLQSLFLYNKRIALYDCRYRNSS